MPKYWGTVHSMCSIWKRDSVWKISVYFGLASTIKRSKTQTFGNVLQGKDIWKQSPIVAVPGSTAKMEASTNANTENAKNIEDAQMTVVTSVISAPHISAVFERFRLDGGKSCTTIVLMRRFDTFCVKRNWTKCFEKALVWTSLQPGTLELSFTRVSGLVIHCPLYVNNLNSFLCHIRILLIPLWGHVYRNTSTIFQLD